MSLKAQVNIDASGDIIIHLNGGINFDAAPSLQKELVSLARSHPTSKITLDMHGVDFVGSSGIGQFVNVIQWMNQEQEVVFLANIKLEFVRVFKLYGLHLPIDGEQADEEVDESTGSLEVNL
jgi:anti-sigma B factor antagonist